MICFIVNRNSRTGKGAKIWDQIQRILRQKKVAYEAWMTEYEGHAMQIAGEICRRTKERVTMAVVGGDGTVNEVLNGITDFEKIRFAVIPTGSGNDYAGGLGISSDAGKALLHILEESHEKDIDLGKVTWNQESGSRYFCVSAGVGMDAIVCQKALTSPQKRILNKLHLGKLTYALLTVETLFSMKTVEVKADFENDGKTLPERCFHKMIFGAAMNMCAEGGGVPMAPGAVPFDGKLSLCMAHTIPKWRTFFLFPLLMMGRHEGIRGFENHPFTVCEMRLNRPTVLHADGEFCGMVTQLRIECLEKKLHIIC